MDKAEARYRHKLLDTVFEYYNKLNTVYNDSSFKYWDHIICPIQEKLLTYINLLRDAKDKIFSPEYNQYEIEDLISKSEQLMDEIRVIPDLAVYLH